MVLALSFLRANVSSIKKFMLRNLAGKKAASTLEYIMLLTMIMTAIYVSQKFIVRGFAGRWKQSADSFGFGKQYDPKKTIECQWSDVANRWYEKLCFDTSYDQKYNELRLACWFSCWRPWGGTGTLAPCGGPVSRGDSDYCFAQCRDNCIVPATDFIARNCSTITVSGISCN